MNGPLLGVERAESLADHTDRVRQVVAGKQPSNRLCENSGAPVKDRVEWTADVCAAGGTTDTNGPYR